MQLVKQHISSDTGANNNKKTQTSYFSFLDAVIMEKARQALTVV